MSALAHLRYFVSDAADEWKHSPGPNLLATATLAAILFVAAVNLLALSNVSGQVGRWKKDLRVSVYLADDAEVVRTEELRARLAAVPGVARVESIDKDEALRRFRASFPELADVPTDLGTNPLPASLEILLEPGEGSRAAAAAIAEAARASPAVEEVRFDQAFLDRLDGILGIARWGGGALGIVVLAAVGLVVAGVLRLAVHARRDEIEIMRLVGASPLFVRGPFLVAGLVQGGAGGLLALFTAEALRRAASTYAGEGGRWTDLLLGRPLPWVPSAAVVATGAILGLASAWFAVREARGYQSKMM
ncbi:MAG TPA: permease-like cell division protein FtsX [Candidatus Polarisedimenticolaceae bacterium]|nr:permease-like cell division protein FtsX [Candidatus Polarisedimenticolaceae bacterium]